MHLRGLFFLVLLLFLSVQTGLAQTGKKSRKKLQISKLNEWTHEPALGGDQKYLSEEIHYNENGNWTLKISYNKSGDITRRISRTYEGKLLREEVYWNPQGTRQLSRTDYQYDEEGNCILKITYRRGKLQYRERFEYESGLRVREIRETESGKRLRERTYTYTIKGEQTEENTETP